MSNNKPITQKRCYIILASIVVAFLVVIGYQFYVIHQLKQNHIVELQKETITKNNTLEEWFGQPFDIESWDPFQEMQAIQERMNKWFDSSFKRFSNSDNFSNLFDGTKFQSDLTVNNKSDKFVITMMVPGANESDLNVKLEDQQLTITGTVSRTNKGSNYSSSFTRSITLPESVDSNSLSTKFNNDKLVITVKKLKIT